jgi:hypothetical protein
VDVTVTRVIHFRKFDPAAAKPSQLEYLLFGRGAERFLAHVITRPPDFDHILAVTSLGPQVTDEELTQGMTLRFPGKTNSVASRIRGVQPVTAQTPGTGGAAPGTL